MVRISFYMTEEERNRVDDFCAKTKDPIYKEENISRSSFIRRAIDEYLTHHPAEASN
jgi:metal-responsive CopG/Arc/MetJ family transcriptional regulator